MILTKKNLASNFSLLVNSTIFIVLWLPGKESTCQCRRFKFDPWVRKIPWKRKCPPIPAFLSGKFHGQRNLAGYSPWGHRVRHDWLSTHMHAHILTLYLVIFENSLILVAFFYIQISWECAQFYTIIWLYNKCSFISLIFILFLSFSYLIIITKISSTVLTRQGENWYFFLFLI